MGHGLDLSFDNGASWKNLLATTDEIHAVTFGPEIRKVKRMLWWCNNSSNFILTSKDGGVTLYNDPGWRTPIGAPGGSCSGIALDSTSPLIGYVGFNINGDPNYSAIYKSTDGGKTFSRLAGVDGLAPSGGYLKGNVVGIAVNPQNPSQVFAAFATNNSGANTAGVAQSNDAGASWSWVEGPFTAAPFTDADWYFDLSHTGTQAVLAIKGHAALGQPSRSDHVFRPVDGSDIRYSDNFHVGTALARMPGYLFMVLRHDESGGSSACFLGSSSDGGGSWTWRELGFDPGRVHHLAAGGNTVFLSVAGAGLKSSRNLGYSWTDLATYAQWGGWTIPDPILPGVVWHCGKIADAQGGIFQSQDNGVTFSPNRTNEYDHAPFAVAAIPGSDDALGI